MAKKIQPTQTVEQATEWISVTERLPELTEVLRGGPRMSRRVLIFNKHDGEVSLGHYEDHLDQARSTGWWDDTQPDWANVLYREALMTGITHWMERPEKPSDIPF